jgi:uncharacterized protein YbaR (Trm112 family)
MNLKKIFTADLFGSAPVATLACPHCETPLTFQPELVGEIVQCPACKGEIAFQALTEHDIALAAIKAKKRRQQNTGVWFCYITGAVLLVLCWPIGLILIAMGLILSAINKK